MTNYEDMYQHAVAIVVENRRASISLVQRHLRIGYVVAAKLLEDMERRGVLSPLGTNGVRTLIEPPPKDDDEPEPPDRVSSVPSCL